MKSFKIIVPFLAVAMMASCTETFTENKNVMTDGVSVSITEPVCGDDVYTKALSSEFSFYFVEDDKINVFVPDNSYEVMNYKLHTESTDGKTASLKANSFTIKDGDYTALYPSQNMPDDVEKIPLTFTGQAQTSNRSSAHLAEYDYCWAEAAIADNSGNFSFEHKVSWLKVSVKATDAANLKSITVYADEGVANTASFNASTGVLTPVRSTGDTLTLALGGNAGIDIAKDSTLTAFIALPAGDYTNLTLKATDAAGKTYKFSRSSKTTLVEGLYYTLTVKRTDIPENTPFTALTAFGSYSKTNTAAPTGVKLYDDDTDQMSYGTGSGYRTFKLANLTSNTYAIFTIASGTLTVGETYTVSSDINGTKSEASCKVVKMTDDCVWLEDKTNNNGYIFAIE